MTPEERTQIEVLVKMIQEEKDASKFIALVEELNALLEVKLTGIAPTKPKSN
jgi:hypothetical protein